MACPDAEIAASFSYGCGEPESSYRSYESPTPCPCSECVVGRAERAAKYSDTAYSDESPFIVLRIVVVVVVITAIVCGIPAGVVLALEGM